MNDHQGLKFHPPLPPSSPSAEKGQVEEEKEENLPQHLEGTGEGKAFEREPAGPMASSVQGPWAVWGMGSRGRWSPQTPTPPAPGELAGGSSTK